MEYRKYGKRYVVRIDRGEEVIAKLQELCEKEDIGLACIEGLKALKTPEEVAKVKKSHTGRYLKPYLKK